MRESELRQADPAPARDAAWSGASYLGLVAAAIAVVALDQVTKALATHAWHGSVEILGGAIFLVYTRNTGAAFSLLPGGGLAFAAVAVLVSGGIVIYYRRVADGPLTLRLALALILGGAIGNLIDRVRLGYVVDFIDLRWWPVFNLADSAVVVGVVLLVIRSLVAGSREAE